MTHRRRRFASKDHLLTVIHDRKRNPLLKCLKEYLRSVLFNCEVVIPNYFCTIIKAHLESDLAVKRINILKYKYLSNKKGRFCELFFLSLYFFFRVLNFSGLIAFTCDTINLINNL